MSKQIINLSAEQAGQNADEQEVAQAPAATTKSPVDDKMEEQRNDSKQAVNERREGGAFGQDEDEAEGHKQDHDRRKPPLFSNAEEAPEFSEDGNSSFHLELLFVIGRRPTAHSLLPIGGVIRFESQVDWLFSEETLQETHRR